MESTSGGASSFLKSGSAYDLFMGRYSIPLAEVFADAAGVVAGQSVLDVGCGPGALTQVLVGRLGTDAVSAVDPSPPFVAEVSTRCPGIDVQLGPAETLPHGDASFDVVLSQLVLHFVADPEQVGREFRRVLRPGGTVAACVWDFADEMEMLRHFWDAALTIDPDAPDEARVLRFGGVGEISGWLDAAGFERVVESTLHVESTYADFDEFWAGFLQGVGPAGSFCVELADDRREALRQELWHRLGSPAGSFTLGATARCAVGCAPA